MAYDVPPPEKRPEPGYYYHFKHDPDGPLNNYAYYIYGVGHHTEDDCRPEDAFMQVYRPLYEAAYAYRNGGMFDLRPLHMFYEPARLLDQDTRRLHAAAAGLPPSSTSRIPAMIRLRSGKTALSRTGL